MSKPESILTDAEMHALICGDPSTLGLSIARLKDFILQVEKAVVAKLVAEQKPVMYARTYNGEIDWDEHCVAADSGTLFDCGSYHDENDKIPEGYAVMPLYTHPMPCVSQMSNKTACVSESGESDTQTNCQRILDNSNHIPDAKKTVVPEGFQLVPVEPTEEMHHAARDWSVKMYGKAIGFEASHGCYKAMLAAAPKYTEGK